MRAPLLEPHQAICTGTPHGRTAPVDPASGALSIGTPVFNVDAWIADENGQQVVFDAAMTTALGMAVMAMVAQIARFNYQKVGNYAAAALLGLIIVGFISIFFHFLSPGVFATVLHLSPVGNPAPPRPLRPLRVTRSITSEGGSSVRASCSAR